MLYRVGAAIAAASGPLAAPPAAPIREAPLGNTLRRIGWVARRVARRAARRIARTSRNCKTSISDNSFTTDECENYIATCHRTLKY